MVKCRQIRRYTVDRRRFLKAITCLPAFALLPCSETGSQDVPRYDTRDVLLLQANVAGFRYYGGHRVLSRINAGDPVILRREPRNPFDRRAIALYWGEEKLGYIPRADNLVIANLLDQGAPLKARIRKKKACGNPREMLEIQVKFST